MRHVLHIETATTVCSVALTAEQELLGLRELDEGYTHAENLHLFIDDLLKSSSVKPAQLAAVAVGRGPGSYTGLRIGVSAAKGLAFALGIPLIAVDTLQLMAGGARAATGKPGLYIPMIDARRMEVYTAAYSESLEMVEPVRALVIDESAVNAFRGHPGTKHFFGNGMEKCRRLLEGLPGAEFLPGIKPSARFMADLVIPKLDAGIFENLADFEPFYLKDFTPGRPKHE